MKSVEIFSYHDHAFDTVMWKLLYMVDLYS